MWEDKFYEAVSVCREEILSARSAGFGGTSYPGERALKICPDILRYFSKELCRTVMVCGTNGKTTTCRILSELLNKKGIRHIANREGANMLPGIVTAFVKNADACGHLTADMALLECDEMFCAQVAGILKPVCIVFTNLSEDQLYRFDTAKAAAQLIKAAGANPETVICINKSDANLMRLASKLVNPIRYYEAGPDGMILDGERITAGQSDKRPVYLQDVAAACMAAKVLGIYDGNSLQLALSAKLPYGRMETFMLGKSKVTFELLKNPANYHGIIADLKKENPYSDLILASADERELVWMEKEDFSLLRELYDSIFVFGSGNDAIYLKTVLKAQAVEYKKILELCREKSGNIFLLSEYYAMLQLRRRFAADGYLHPMWQD